MRFPLKSKKQRRSETRRPWTKFMISCCSQFAFAGKSSQAVSQLSGPESVIYELLAIPGWIFIWIVTAIVPVCPRFSRPSATFRRHKSCRCPSQVVMVGVGTTQAPRPTWPGYGLGSAWNPHWYLYLSLWNFDLGRRYSFPSLNSFEPITVTTSG